MGTNFDTTNFDRYFNNLVYSCIIEFSFDKIAAQLEQYDNAVRKTDPKGLADKERDEFIGILCNKYADDLKEIQGNAFKQISKLIDQMTEEDKGKFFSWPYEDFVNIPEIGQIILDSVVETIRQDVARLSAKW